MAYMSKERKAELAPRIKYVLAKYNLKGTLSVDNHSTLVLKIKSGPINFFDASMRVFELNMSTYEVESALKSRYCSVNKWWIDHSWRGIAREAITELQQAMDVGNHDRSDSQSDYFDVGWYTDISIGTWNAPYEVKKDA